MSSRPLTPALLSLGLAALIATPQQVHAQTKPVLTTIHTFARAYGRNPADTLALGPDGAFYGTTPQGGYNNNGTLFRITATGQFTTLIKFNGDNGQVPRAVAVQSDGSVYGVTFRGGPSGGGVLYRYAPNGHLTILRAFAALNSNNTSVGGSAPNIPFQAPDGSFYGTTYEGGGTGGGVFYHLLKNGTFTVLHEFSGPDGSGPRESLALNQDGSFYGTTAAGGSKGDGTVFRLSLTGKVSVLHSFDGRYGRLPFAGLTLGSDGAYYGTTYEGDVTNGGTLYKITTDGKFTTLHNFGKRAYGVLPAAGLTAGPDGNFYGATVDGGDTTSGDGFGYGTVFSMTPSGVVTILHRFSPDASGSRPTGGLTFGSDGALYGTTNQSGSAKGDGTIFKLTLP